MFFSWDDKVLINQVKKCLMMLYGGIYGGFCGGFHGGLRHLWRFLGEPNYEISYSSTCSAKNC